MANKRYPKILAIVGPTAVGKTELSIKLASKFDGEIVSVDSRQIYKHMDIGTSKPSYSSMASIKHHLVDSLCPDQEYNLAIFLDRANIAISDILSRNKVPIIVGGTGQYFWGLIEGWSIPAIKPNLKLRKDLTDISQYVGKETLKRHLSAIDKNAYNRIDLNNPRRLIRAIELAMASIKTVPSKGTFPYNTYIIGLELEPSILKNKIDSRVKKMFDSGWVDEVNYLLDNGYLLNLPALSSLGYKEIASYIKNGTNITDCIKTIQRRTNRFSKQQMNWFSKSDCRINWFNSDSDGHSNALNASISFLK